MSLVSALAVSSSAMADTKTLKVNLKNGNEELAGVKMYAQPLSSSVDAKAEEMSLDGNTFALDVEASPEGLYRLIFIYKQTQTIVPVYAKSGNATITVDMTMDGNMPVADNDDNNKALSAMGRFVSANDRMMWEKRTDDKAELTSMLRAYQVAADSILSVYPKCDATVTKYINMWAYTSTYNSFISLPNILGVRPDALPVKGEEVMDKPYRVVDNPLGVVFPIVPSLVANFLPRQASLKEQMDSLYANYTCSELTTKVCEAVMDKYLSRFDYENKFEEGLAELQEVTQKHGLDKKYVNTFKANRSTVKGSPFPASVKLVDADGKEMDFAQFRGKYVYIDMWASWCVPCCREVPHLQKLESELESDDVVFLSISIDKNKEAWKKKMAELKAHGNQWHDSEGTLGTALNVKGIPFFLIYDKEGKLYMYNAPRPSMGFALKELLEGLK